MIKCVIFDLDGTLLSTLETITYHLNKALFSHSLGSVTLDDTRRFIGNGARKLVLRALAKNGVDDEDTLLRVLETYNRSYDSDPLPLTYPYDGVVRLVDSLYERGVILGVVTNKPEPTAIKLVESFFPKRFTFIRGGKSGVTLKPDPTEALALLYGVGLDESECAFVGDTDVDILTGKNMGAALSIGVSWGFRSREELALAGADLVLGNAEDVLRVITEQV